ncbi:hypothetical protein BKA70DRAFT_1562155 [Coprinopsis sp. MPI-PUGE-AT-0042]|nr:hypothetical protein BKA70DRAFT_1562155 [Coprinopsis sp. MPI-PUGE-AT-0042]
MTFPASCQLPDEIIKEILAPALYVSDEAFSSTCAKSNPFANYELSTSTILVVCKSWLRVATPMLYETVVLRSKAQAQALASALKQNEQLGRFIRKLRVEGGYGTFVYEVLRRSSSLTDLWLSTGLWSNESIAGYLKGFQLVNPRRLIVVDSDGKTSAIRKKIYEALAEAVRHPWTSLISFESYDTVYASDRVAPLLDSLLGASRLKYLCLHRDLFTAEVKLATIPSLKQIRYITKVAKPPFEGLQEPPSYRDQLQSFMRSNRELYDKVVYERPPEDDSKSPLAVIFPNSGQNNKTQGRTEEAIIPAPMNPNWRPLSQLSDQSRKRILVDILRYAMSLSSLGTSMITTSAGKKTLQHFRAGLRLVSREYNELATPFLFEAPMLVKTQGLAQLVSSPNVRYIKSLWLDYRNHDHQREVLTAALIQSCENLALVSEVRYRPALERALNVQHESTTTPYLWSQFQPAIRLPSTTIVALSKTCARTLQHLHLNVDLADDVDEDHITELMQALGQLQELRSLAMTGTSRAERLCDLKDKAQVSRFRFQPDAFPHLERLATGRGSLLHTVSISALCRVKLPALRWLLIDGVASKVYLDPLMRTFLEVHGRKLTSLQSSARIGTLFAHCSNVKNWHARCSGSIDSALPGYDFDSLAASKLKPNPCVEYALDTITISEPSFIFGVPEAEALLNTDLSRLTKLTTVHITHLEWPKSQRDIDKSLWVKLAEAMVEKWNVKLKDGEGKAWVPRLKAVKPTRKK